MLNTVINFLFKNFIALWRHLAKTQLLSFIHIVQIVCCIDRVWKVRSVTKVYLEWMGQSVHLENQDLRSVHIWIKNNVIFASWFRKFLNNVSSYFLLSAVSTLTYNAAFLSIIISGCLRVSSRVNQDPAWWQPLMETWLVLYRYTTQTHIVLIITYLRLNVKQ